MNFPVNTLVWARQHGYPWWPAVIHDPRSAPEIVLAEPHSPQHLCVRFLGYGSIAKST